MAKLSNELIAKIQEAAERISYGEIVIYLADHMNTIDIEVKERVRYEKATPPRPGEIVTRKAVVRVTRTDS